jgi:hypothetical protein
MFGINPEDVARSIRSGLNGTLSSFQASRKPVAEPQAGDWASTFRSLVDPRLTKLSTPSGMRPTQAVASAPMPLPSSAPTSMPGTPSGNTESQRQAALALARQMFGDEGERQLNTTFDVESGWNGAIGDKNLSPVGSYGPLQFYGGGGQLNNYAAALGIKDLVQAGKQVQANPLDAIKWALNNYYGNALRAGMDSGLRGEDLAQYIQQNGQRSQNPERARDVYRRLYG